MLEIGSFATKYFSSIPGICLKLNKKGFLLKLFTTGDYLREAADQLNVAELCKYFDLFRKGHAQSQLHFSFNSTSTMNNCELFSAKNKDIGTENSSNVNLGPVKCHLFLLKSTCFFIKLAVTYTDHQSVCASEGAKVAELKTDALWEEALHLLRQPKNTCNYTYVKMTLISRLRSSMFLWLIATLLILGGMSVCNTGGPSFKSML
jgi:hypothetical protein